MNDALDVALRLVVVFVAFLVLPLVVGQTEHKVMAHMQGRLGPMYAGGFHGWAQLVADGVKFAQKEDVVPADADRRVFQLAPAIALLPYLLVLLAIPVGPGDGAVGAVIDAGIFFVLAVMGVGVLGSLMAGWASANKFSLLGGLRTAAQLLAYELPMLLAAASVAMAAGTVSSPASSTPSSGGGCPGRSSAPSSSSWRVSPNFSVLPSTCRSPTPRSSSARTPSTPGCVSRSSSSPSTRESWCSAA